jgi:Cdc6-like AAA superfamily ATPase
MVTRADLLNAFVPSSSMDDPQRFAGRSMEVAELADALQTEGSVPLIYGQRGLGKSSLAAQVARIAQGDVELLHEIEAAHLALPPEAQFITFYVTCEDSTKNLRGLLKLMINAVEALKFEREATEKGDEYRLVDKKTKRGLSLKLFKFETTKSYEVAVSERDLSAVSPSERLVALAETLTDIYKQPVLFVIDELDRLSSVRGLASFLKSNSSAVLKFALVGIGTTESQLLGDHASLTRQLTSVQIPQMKKEELESIVEQTEGYLADNGFGYRFSSGARRELARLASGFPWFVHIIGQRALVEADAGRYDEITTAHINDAVVQLSTRRLARTYYDLYQTAVRDSYPRELVLKLFAQWPKEDIPTSEMYRIAARLGINAPANYVGHLTQEQCGSVLRRSPQQNRGLYRFSDEMFKVYSRIRPSLYEGVDEAIQTAFQK